MEVDKPTLYNYHLNIISLFYCFIIIYLFIYIYIYFYFICKKVLQTKCFDNEILNRKLKTIILLTN